MQRLWSIEELGIGQIHSAIREAVGESGMRHPYGDDNILQLTIALGNADRANIALMHPQIAWVFRSSSPQGNHKLIFDRHGLLT